MLSPKTARLLSFVFLAAILPLVALYALLVYAASPVSYGGMNGTVSLICYIAFTMIFGALIIVAFNFSRQLAREAKGQYQTP